MDITDLIMIAGLVLICWVLFPRMTLVFIFVRINRWPDVWILLGGIGMLLDAYLWKKDKN